MLRDIFRIAFLCIVLGGASIPLSFGVNSSPVVVWIGNSLGSLISAWAVIFIAERLTNDKFRNRVRKFRIGNKVVTVMDEGGDNKHVAKARGYIDRHGIKLFALICPIFPGALLSTTAVYTLGLDKKTYKRWLVPGIFLVSGIYVFSYWWLVLGHV